MRKPDNEVREVTCSVTGKPMHKIPLWLADVKVNFVSEEAHRKQGYAIPYDIADQADLEEDTPAPIVREEPEEEEDSSDEDSYEDDPLDE